MESDLGAFSEDCEEEVENFLKAIGVAPLFTPAAADDANIGRDTTTTEPAPTLSVDGTNGTVGPTSALSQATVAGSVERQWLGTDVSAASTLVVLVTAICRRALALKECSTQCWTVVCEVGSRRIKVFLSAVCFLAVLTAFHLVMLPLVMISAKYLCFTRGCVYPRPGLYVFQICPFYVFIL